MTARIIETILGADLTAPYAVLVWIGVILALIWAILMADDPANAGLPEWDLRLRRTGVIIMLFGMLLTVLFGGNQAWAPWPTSLITAFGFDFYLASAILTARHRSKLRDTFVALRRPDQSRRTYARWRA